MTEGENAVCQDELTPIIKEMTKPRNLNAIYQDLKNTYFQGWDQGNEWRIRTLVGVNYFCRLTTIIFAGSPLSFFGRSCCRDCVAGLLRCGSWAH